MVLIYGAVLRADPVGPVPSAEGFIFIVGVICAIVIGFLLYQLFISKEE